MEIIGKCAYCKDPILDFQAKIKVGKEKLHRGCLHILTEENPLSAEGRSKIDWPTTELAEV